MSVSDKQQPRIIILAPHPDDEVVGFCISSLRARQQNNAQVFVTYLTDGCLSQDTLWSWQRSGWASRVSTRRQEALAVADFLGLKVVGKWPDMPSRQLWRNLPSAFAIIDNIIKSQAITEIWLPAFEGGHPDHDALNAFGVIFAARGFQVYEFAEYNWHGGRTRQNQFPYPNGGELTITLTPEEQAIKKQALQMYRSERGNLGYVGIAQEVRRKLTKTAHDYAMRPHDGKLWYNRFGWVPFNHPRIDRTTPQEVSRAIIAALAMIAA